MSSPADPFLSVLSLVCRIRVPSPLEPDYSRAVACRCVKAARAREQENRLLKFSNLGMLANCDFASIDESGLGGDSGTVARDE